MRYLILIAALLFAGCSFQYDTDWPWDENADKMSMEETPEEPEICLPVVQRLKAVCEAMWTDCEEPTVSPTQAAPARAADAPEYPKILKRTVTTYENGLPETTVEDAP